MATEHSGFVQNLHRVENLGVLFFGQKDLSEASFAQSLVDNKVLWTHALGRRQTWAESWPGARAEAVVAAVFGGVGPLSLSLAAQVVSLGAATAQV